MTEDLIKKLKDVKQALVSKDMTGEEWEEREEILEKLEDVTTYLKDALGKGIESLIRNVLCRDPGIMQERSSDTDGSGSIFIIRWDSM